MGPADNNGMKNSSVPKLAWDGSNWVAWKMQMLAMLASNRGMMCHLEGKSEPPIPV